jgi:hypothetical protein
MRTSLIVAAAVLALVSTAAPAAARHGLATGKGPAFRYALVGRIGRAGTGPGTIQTASGVAVDQVCADVYISDKGRGVVDRFDSDGRFLNAVGRPGRDAGGIGTPYGLFVTPANVSPVNPEGAPPACTGPGTLVRTVWVADEAAGRISTFSPDGTWNGGWCSSPPALQPSGCTVRRGSGSAGGFPAGPVDVWVGDHAVYTPFGGLIREYDLTANYVADSSVLSGPASVAASGGRLWATESTSKLALLAADPTSGTLPLLRELGSGRYDGKTPGSFAGPRAVATAPNGNLYVLDSTRVQVFDASGRYLNAITLPADFGGASDVAVRYDGTVYVTGADRPGALVYSPGPLVALRLRQVGARRIQLTGTVRPAHAGSAIELQRVESGYRTVARIRLDRRSAFRTVWTAPRAHAGYAFRAFFHDPHAYHADRASRLEQLVLK